LRYQPLFWGFTGLVAVLALIFFILLYQMLHRPLRQFVGAFRDLEEGRFNVRLDHRHRDEFHDLYSGFNAMADRLQHLVEEVFKKTIYAQQAELKQLQSQISPHFLYNSFFVLQNMADSGDAENLSDYAGLMGQYFQYITRNARADATLADEVDHARIYAVLQTRRFRNRLSLQFDDLPPACRDCLIPRLILQPILENAFEHGLKNKMADGWLRISFQTAENRLLIRIADNGDTMDQERMNELNGLLQSEQDTIETTGLVNVHRRLQLRFGSAFGLKLAQTPGGGLTVDLAIPVYPAGKANRNLTMTTQPRR
jgi:two-component system sensor histidine kinase YesM